MSDTLASLRQALSPKGGMRRIPLPLESYQHPSLPLSAKRLVNLYPEKAPDDARSPAALISTPGLSPTAYTFGAGPVYCMNADQPGTIYAVSGTHFYRFSGTIGGGEIVEDLGEVGSPGGDDYAFNLMSTIAVGVTAAVVCVPPRAYTCAHNGALNQIGGTFPGARSVTYLDGYFVFTNDDLSAQFFCSLLLDPTAYDALDFATADGVPNLLRRAMTLRGEIWLVGEKAVEVWYNAGQQDFPFRRQFGGTIPYGTASTKTVALCDGSIFWVTDTNVVVRSKPGGGYGIERVSTHAIEAIIREQTISNTVSALSYTQDGHVFYCVNYTTRSLVYDTSTKMWHERASSAGGTGRWLANAAVQQGEHPVFGSCTNGHALLALPTVETEDGTAIARSLILPPLWAGTHLAACNRLEIELETGGAILPGTITIEWSDDGGVTWPGSRTMSASTTRGARRRYFTTRLGSFRERIFRITALHKVTIYAIDADITAPPAGT